MLTMLEQLVAYKVPATKKQKQMTAEAEDRAREVFDTLKGIGNATIPRLMQDLPHKRDAMRRYLRILLEQNKVVSWKIGNSTWYSVARPPKRRK